MSNTSAPSLKAPRNPKGPLETRTCICGCQRQFQIEKHSPKSFYGRECANRTASALRPRGTKTKTTKEKRRRLKHYRFCENP